MDVRKGIPHVKERSWSIMMLEWSAKCNEWFGKDRTACKSENVVDK